MKKGLFLVGTLLILGGAAGGGYWYYTQNHPAAVENAVYVSEVSSLSTLNSGYVNRYAGVVEAQETVEVNIESGRKVTEVGVKVGDVVKKGQLLFEYDLSSIEQDLQTARLDLEKLKNEAASLNNQIATLEKDKKRASADNQLSYTIEIETAKMNLKKNEYDQVSKQSEVERLENATGNTEVRSSIDGVIQKIDTNQLNAGTDDSVVDTLDDYGSYGYGDSSENNAFIKILSTGEYRVKGSVNELNINFLAEGEPIIIRSRADETKVWNGIMGTIDRENASSSNSNNYFGMTDANDGETNSSTYPFYVELSSSDGLMLGQHVYIEPDNGQMVSKTGVWLSEAYIVDPDSDEAFVWAANNKNRLEKRKVVLGQYNDMLGEYEILEGLSKMDYLAYPQDSLEEGMPTTTNESEAMDFGEDEYVSYPDEESYDLEGFEEYGDSFDYSVDDMGEFSEDNIVSMEDIDSTEDIPLESASGIIEEFEDIPEIEDWDDFDSVTMDEEMEDIK